MKDAPIVFAINSLGEERHVQDVAKGLRVVMNGIIYERDIISKIEIFKFTNKDNSREKIFVDLYMGNMCLASWLLEEKVVLSEDRYFPVESEKESILYGYMIRLPYDHEK